MKKTNLFENCDFETLIQVHNPFGIKANDGNIKFFTNYAEVYYYVLDVLYTQFKLGYIDMIYLISVLTGVKVGACEDLFRQMKPIWGEQPERIFEYHWEYDYCNKHMPLQIIFRSLHLITETQFDEVAFRKAYEMFRLKLAKEGFGNL